MPRDDLAEPVAVDVPDSESLLQLLGCESGCQVLAKCRLTMLAEAVVTVEVIGDKAVQTAVHAVLQPGLQYLLPRRIAQAGPIFVHAADRISASGDRRAVRVFLQEFQGI